MTSLNADLIRKFTSDSINDRLEIVEVFEEIGSTNSYLMQKPEPAAGNMCVAVTNNQTAGRGRHGKTWELPAGAGVCLSASYTFHSRPEHFSSLTLVIGLAAIAALEELGVANVQLKWPNDLFANDGKLAGILTEVQKQRSSGAMTVVTGIGVNVDLPGDMRVAAETDWAKRVVDLKSLCATAPQQERLAGALMNYLCNTFVEFESDGFVPFAQRWTGRDWLLGRRFTVETADNRVTGVGAGIADDGALLLDTSDTDLRRITAGSIVSADSHERAL